MIKIAKEADETDDFAPFVNDRGILERRTEFWKPKGKI